MRQREVHIVAAEHQVVAHADSRQLRLPILHLHLDEGEVGGAAAHVADQHEARVRQFGAKRAAMPEQPVIESRLRLFQQPQLRQLRHACRFERQGAGAVVERGGHGEHHVLLFERGVWKAVVPGCAHMRQIASAGGDR